ncbi:uncharacterized protein LOC124113640 [Haliotis rufescens]|uniref:uncharacterized protein LOC124113640 n=1 Tax=Haliotis rufescens TaxID=6454 RepID=UPI00201E9FDC|nr:uncharacterized protein LOC124113640 [Haliotis rufescens]
MDTIFLFSLVLAIIVAVCGEAKQNIYASGCNEQELKLDCGAGHRIAIKRLFYGVKLDAACVGHRRTRRDCCTASHADCMVNREESYLDINTQCSGYPSCKFMVKKVTTSGQCLKKTTDFMTIIYDCIADADIASFCSDTHKRGKELYIANTEYPSSIRGNKPRCSCLATTEQSRGISLHSIDILIAMSEYGGRTCTELIKIEDSFNYKKQITCGHRGLYGFRALYERSTRNVTISLESQSNDRGTAYVWFQIKAEESNDFVNVYCGEALRRLLAKPYQDAESRDRTKAEGSDEKLSTVIPRRPENESASAAIFPLTSDMAAIVGGIVAASFVIFAILIISIAVHCRRVRRAKEPVKRVEMYPAMSPTPSLDVASYCRYDYDDDHYCSISRSPLKVSSQYDYNPNKNVVLGSAEYSQPDEIVGEELPAPPPPYNGGLDGPQTEPLMSVPPRDYLTLREEIDSAAGNRTMPPPQDYYAVINKKGNKSPPPKTRSKSVTFSQPVAMVTPLPSGSDESMMDREGNEKTDEFPPPVLDSPTKPETIQIPRYEGGQPLDSPARPLSTFRSPDEEMKLSNQFDLPPPPPEDYDMDNTCQAQYDNIPYYSGQEKSFWLPPHNYAPNAMPNGKVRNIYETGV